MLVIIILKLLFKILRMIVIVIVSNKLHFAIITIFKYLQKKNIFAKIFITDLLYFFILYI